jgi:hypothetical protein
LQAARIPCRSLALINSIRLTRISYLLADRSTRLDTHSAGAGEPTFE